VYVRLHGDAELYASGYGEPALERWADRIERWQHGGQADDARLAAPDATPAQRNGRDVYVYFDNDVKVHAPYDAAALSRRLGIDSPLPARDPTATPRPEAAVRKTMPGLRRTKRGNGSAPADPPRRARG
jgi:uncharacterized protein YecE (DUF72 family)